jgi:hypothetical protein
LSIEEASIFEATLISNLLSNQIDQLHHPLAERDDRVGQVLALVVSRPL